MRTSCSDSVIIGDFSTGGVIKGFSLCKEIMLQTVKRMQ